MLFQPTLLDSGAPSFDASFAGVRRIELDERSWVDLDPEWVSGSDDLFAALVDGADWHQGKRHMYDKVVDQPRLSSWWDCTEPGPCPFPHVVDDMRAALSERYRVFFDSVGLNWYRHGRDSVAWHGDKIAKTISDPIVALVSVGEPRKFLLKPRAGGASRPFQCGRGTLLVTGGACQREWLHSVPKVARAGPRISIAFRHS